MKKFLVSIMIAVTALSMVAEAGARPLGGGRSIGRQSPTVARQAPAPVAAPAPQRAAAAPAPVAPAAMPARPPSMWKGMLGGALLGLGLGAVLSHFGMGGAMASAFGSILMIALLALAVMFIIRMFRRSQAPANGSYSAYSNVTPLPAGGAAGAGVNLRGTPAPEFAAPVAVPAAAAAPWGVPADFDTANFLRHAKASFIRMQAAWDKADVNDLREFTTPEVYAELKLQIQERGNVGDFTDVVSIDGELLGIETTASDYLASVRFTGMIRSAPTAPAEPFAEVWNMAKPLSGASGWVLAGIQQLPA